MYFDSRMSIKIPIFPLPLVLLPGEKLPLHIFEEKYKKMIEYCLKNNKNFGIVNSKNKDLLTIGCIASIDQLFGSDVYDNNEYDILVTGNERFIVKGYDDSKIYRQAYIKSWKDLEKKVNKDLLSETNVFLYEVLMLDIDKRAKKILLKSQSENDRLIVLKRILKKAILKIDYNDSQSIEYSDYNQFEA